MFSKQESTFFPSQCFLQLARNHLSLPGTKRVSLARIGFSSWSSSRSQILDFSSLAYQFASAFLICKAQDGDSGKLYYKKNVTNSEFGHALNSELKSLLEYAMKEAKVAEAGSSSIQMSIPHLDCRVHIQVEVLTLPHNGILRHSKDILNVYISLAPPDEQGEDIVQQIVGCWKWCIIKVGPWSLFWGQDLCLGGSKEASRGTREWWCCGGGNGEDEGEDEGEVWKPLLVKL